MALILVCYSVKSMAESIDRNLDRYLSTTTDINCIQQVRLSCVAQNVNVIKLY